jgi:hypothetical protein
MAKASCLCGAVKWEMTGPFKWTSHCHCSRCRKSHGTAYATYVLGPANQYRLLAGAEHVVKWESMPGFYRCFCGQCGSVVPGEPYGDDMFVPAGNFEEDAGVVPKAHIFAASKAPWFEITDTLRRFDVYPPGVDAPVVADREPLDPPGPKPRGSCLCGGVTFVVEGELVRSWNCHCGRCRRAKSAAFSTHFVTRAGGVRFTRGRELVAEFKVPDAKHFRQAFCRICGSVAPRIDPERDLGLVPMGSFDDDPGARATAHIFVGWKAPWHVITDALPQHAEYPA